jgi:hypothetical protein
MVRNFWNSNESRSGGTSWALRKEKHIRQRETIDIKIFMHGLVHYLNMRRVEVFRFFSDFSDIKRVLNITNCRAGWE